MTEIELQRLILEIKELKVDLRPQIVLWTVSKNRDHARGYNEAIDDVLKMLSKK